MEKQSGKTLGLGAGVVIFLLFAGGIFAFLKCSALAGVVSFSKAIEEIGIVAAVVLAGGGYAWPLVRGIAPKNSPVALRVISAVLLGLWMLSTAILAAGTFVSGALTALVWWLVIGGGIVLAVWQARKRILAWKPPRRLDARSLIWIFVALAVGIWLAGVTTSIVFFRSNDVYDVLEYHLQIPREFYLVGRITPLNHNCYSFYPLGTEMLFLLAMVLRGGVYDGLYPAAMMHGGFAILAVAAIYFVLKGDAPARGRYSAILLATVPFVLYLSWLAMVELAMLAWLTLALLWMRQWTADQSKRSASCAGIMIGGACAVKYLAVGFVALPLLAMMLIFSVRNRKRLAHILLTCFAILVMFSPWLIRNGIYTGNAVFPLATGVFGRGHWSEESEKRWVDGHGPADKPPVPIPHGWSAGEQTSRGERFFTNFLFSFRFGLVAVILAIAALWWIIRDKNAGKPWDWMLMGVCIVQLAVWAAFTHGMPSRFIIPIVVPISLLAGGTLAKLSQVRSRLWKKSAVAIFVIAVAGNLFASVLVFKSLTRGLSTYPLSGREVTGETFPYHHIAELDEGSRILLVAEAKAFYFPQDTIYATAFDAHPLAQLLERKDDAQKILGKLRAMGITHLWVNWNEMARLADTYGYPASLVSDFFHRRDSSGPVTTTAFDKLGLKVVEHLFLPNQPTSEGNWPYITIYVLND